MLGLGTYQCLVIVAMTMYASRQKKEEESERAGGTMLRERASEALAPRHPTKRSGGWCPSTVRSLRRLRQLVAPGLTGAAARMMRSALVELLGTDSALTEVRSPLRLLSSSRVVLTTASTHSSLSLSHPSFRLIRWCPEAGRRRVS